MKRLLILSLILPFMCSCTSNSAKDEPKVGKYVYLDSHNVLHVKNPCVLGLAITDEKGNEYYKSVQRLDLYAVREYHLLNLCAWCVDDGTYEELQEIVMLNKFED